MNVFLNIPVNSKLISLINERERFLNLLKNAQLDAFPDDFIARLRFVETLIVTEITLLTSEANLLERGLP
jgi:hypothetical protein